ncbi:ankyrin repeat domain-containing protein [Leptospira barantonii]|uniref:Ankyrin repeat domain-containing protein n=1 Tax=Leptospira barantonii TaxID=2023184 RepID=A0A5F2AXM6_9LEPT|nr:ankyrin repeat domain-containing protein [Leptospira barantonii]TGL92752.1 ankyrin repeat domain-containing protein [Leptospira barantonii]
MSLSEHELQESLSKAIRAEEESKIIELISAGADPNRITYVKSLEVPLWFSALPISFSGGVSFKSKSLSALLQNGADLHATNGKGSNALSSLVYYCKDIERFSEAVKVLVSFGMNLNQGKETGKTILYSAVSSGSFEKVKFLLEQGADPNTVDIKDGESPLIRACINSDKEQDQILKIVSALISAGADVNVHETWTGRSSLMWAVRQGNLEVAKLLAKAGADLKAENPKENLNAYLTALELKHYDIVEWLDGQGAKDTSARPYRALQYKNIQKEEWKESIAAGLKAKDAFPDDWKVPYNIAFAYWKLGALVESGQWAQKTLDIEFNLGALNLIFTNYIHKSDPEGVLSVWKKHKTQAMGDKGNSGDKGTVLTNVLWAYYATKKYSEAIEDLGDPWGVSTDENTFFLNLACIYVALGDTSSAIRAVMETLRLKYPIDKLKKDADLKPLAETTAFRVLIDNVNNRHVSETLSRGEDSIEIILNDDEVIERKQFAEEDIPQNVFKFDSPHEAILKFAALEDEHIGAGWKLDSSKVLDVENDLAAELNEVLLEYADSQKADLGALLLEWDYEDDGFSYYLCLETYQNLEKARKRYSEYHGTDKNTVYENNLEHRDRIYAQVSFERMIDRLIQGEGFQKVKKLPLFFFVHAEHDSGNEFSVERKV